MKTNYTKDEGNRLIAEFMGWRYSKTGLTARKLDGRSPYRVRDIHYDTSWDWLMPVAKKLLYEFAIGSSHFESISFSVFRCEIVAAWQAITTCLSEIKREAA